MIKVEAQINAIGYDFSGTHVRKEKTPLYMATLSFYI